ncbi:MAG: ABC transporter permease [Treponema sp.]|nr:ABC transporter permease [Candidatus Treponema caballi]
MFQLKSDTLRFRMRSWRGPLLSIAAGLVTAALIIVFTAKAPTATLAAFFKAPFSSAWYTGRMLNTASLLLMAALGALLSLKAGELNLGGEGQVYAGGFVTAVFLNAVCPQGLESVPGPAVTALIMLAALLLAALTGALLTFIPELLALFKKIPVLLSTFLLSLATIPLIDAGIGAIVRKTGGNLLSTPQISSAFRFTRLLPPSQLNASSLIILVVFAVVFFWLYATRSGEIFRICGLAPEFALYSGFHLRTNRAAGLLLSGAFHGMTGFFAITGTYFACQNGFYSGMGWNALTISLIAQNAPELLLPASLILAWLFTASDSVVLTGNIAGDMTSIIQAVVMLTITIRFVAGRKSRSLFGKAGRRDS